MWYLWGPIFCARGSGYRIALGFQHGVENIVQILCSDWSILITLSKCCHLTDYAPEESQVLLTGNVEFDQEP